MKRIAIAVLLGQLVGPLGYVEPLYLLLILVAPMVTGAIAAVRSVPLVLVAALWASAGINMAWLDWALYREDVAYHLAVSVVMPLLASLGYGIVLGISRLRRRRVSPALVGNVPGPRVPGAE